MITKNWLPAVIKTLTGIFLLSGIIIYTIKITSWTKSEWNTPETTTPFAPKSNPMADPWSQKIISMYKFRGDLYYMKSQIGKARRTLWKKDTASALNAIIRKIDNIMENMNLTMDLKPSAPLNDIKKDEKPEVCPEKYMGNSYGEFNFHEGWVREKCKTDKKFTDLISVLINVADKPEKFHKNDLIGILKGIVEFYPGIQVFVAANAELPKDKLTNVTGKINLKIVKTKKGTKAGSVWNNLVKLAKTKYVLVAHSIDHFFGFDARLERLVREMTTLRLKYAGSATRFPSGHWNMGCQQMSLRNYTLTFQSGYDLSSLECVFCNVLTGPFVALQKTLADEPFDEDMPDDVLFYEYFVSKYNLSYHAAVCPDSMFYLEETDVSVDSWYSLAKKHKIVNINLENGKKITFDCADLGIKCEKIGTLAISPCCVKELVEGILYVLDVCAKNNITCELMEGTLLSAIKMQSSFPWEVDADLKFSYFSYDKLVEAFKKEKHSLQIMEKNGYHPDGEIINSYVIYHQKNWFYEFTGTVLESDELLKQGLPNTKILFYGRWVNIVRNPGNYARNRYGYNIYKHVEHWRRLKLKEGDKKDAPGDSFHKCVRPKSSACLDRFNNDGNIQFRQN